MGEPSIMITPVILLHYLIGCLYRAKCSLNMLAVSLVLRRSSSPTTQKLVEQQETLKKKKKKKAEGEENLIEIVVDFFQQVSPQLLSKHANEIFQQDLKQIWRS